MKLLDGESCFVFMKRDENTIKKSLPDSISTELREVIVPY